MSRSYAVDYTQKYTEPVADVLVVPIVDETEDKSYAETEIPFDLTIEHVFHTMD